MVRVIWLERFRDGAERAVIQGRGRSRIEHGDAASRVLRRVSFGNGEGWWSLVMERIWCLLRSMLILLSGAARN